MPMAPTLPPEAMAAAQAQSQSGGLSPANFLIAAADMHNSGALSAPVPTGKDLVTPSQKGNRLVQKHIRLLK